MFIRSQSLEEEAYIRSLQLIRFNQYVFQVQGKEILNYKTMVTFTQVFLTTLLIGYASAHVSFLGRCDTTPTKMVDFDMDKFLGKWYISESFNEYDECMTWEFVRDDEPDTWMLIERKESGVYHKVGLEHAEFNTAHIYRDFSTNNTARMRIKWPLSMAGDAAFTVHDTDYYQYASLFECQNVAIFHRQNGLVLSRIPQIRIDLRQMARIQDENIDVSYYKKVRQGNCAYRHEEEEEEEKENKEDAFMHQFSYAGDHH